MLKSELKFSKIIISLLSTREFILSDHIEVYLQKVFSQTLKEISCQKKENLCEQCNIPTCPFYQIFQDKNDKTESQEYRPYPYIINCSDKYLFFKSELFEISLTIFGDYIQYMPVFIKTFQKMGEKGIGNDSAKFQLFSVKDEISGEFLLIENELIHNSPKQIGIFEYIDSNFGKTVIQHDSPPQNDFAQNILVKNYLRNIQFTFLTPAILNKEQINIQNLSSNLLFEEAIERYTIMHLLYGDFKDGETLGRKQVFLSNSGIESVQKSKFSKTNQKYQQSKGILGICKISNIDEKMFQLLKTLEILHIGKNACYGMGKVKVDNWILVK